MIYLAIVPPLAVLAVVLGNVLGWLSTGSYEWRWQVLLGPWMYERALRRRRIRSIWAVFARIGGKEEGR